MSLVPTITCAAMTQTYSDWNPEEWYRKRNPMLEQARPSANLAELRRRVFFDYRDETLIEITGVKNRKDAYR